MELGGNKRASDYYKKHNMFKDGNPNHEHPALSAYKANLLAEALKELGPDEISAPVSHHQILPTLIEATSKQEQQQTKTGLDLGIFG